MKVRWHKYHSRHVARSPAWQLAMAERSADRSAAAARTLQGSQMVRATKFCCPIEIFAPYMAIDADPRRNRVHMGEGQYLRKNNTKTNSTR